MRTLALLVSTDDELVRHLAGRECDRVVSLSDLFGDDFDERTGSSWNSILLVTDSVVLLRAVLPQLSRVTSTSRNFRVVVGGHPRPGLIRLPAGPVGLRAIASAQREPAKLPVPHVTLSVQLEGAVRLSHVLAAMLADRTSPFEPPAASLRVGITDDVPHMMSWACGDPSARRLSTDALRAQGDAPDVVDVVLSRAPANGAAHPVVLALGHTYRSPSWKDLLSTPAADIERFASLARTDLLVPPVDTDTLTPAGFVVAAPRNEGWLRCVDWADRHTLVFDDRHGQVSPTFDDWSGLNERATEYARAYQMLHDNAAAHRGPVQHAAFLIQAACAALPIVTHEVSDTVCRLLGAELTALFTSVRPSDFADDVQREAYCMAIRRSAFAQHGARPRWRSMAGENGLRAPSGPSVSVIVATRRPDLLERAVDQVAQQDWQEAELILGLHGIPQDDPRVARAVAAYPGPAVVAEIAADRPFGQVLNDLCAMASGDLLAKMDDDDWYSRHHLTDLVHAAEYSHADLVGAGAEFIYLTALDTTVRRHKAGGHRYSNRVPGAALLISSEVLRSVGGWRPVHRGVDTALAQAIADSGGSIYRGHGLGIVVFRAAEGHTWDPGAEYFVRGETDQWPGFAPPPGIIGSEPMGRRPPPSWFDHAGRVA